MMLPPQERAGVHNAADPAGVERVLQRDPAAPTDTRRGEGG